MAHEWLMAASIGMSRCHTLSRAVHQSAEGEEAVQPLIFRSVGRCLKEPGVNRFV